MAALAWLAVDEYQASSLQARYLAGLGRKLTFRVEPGPSHAIAYPAPGPYDERFGYAQLPRYIDKLRSHGIRTHALLAFEGH